MKRLLSIMLTLMLCLTGFTVQAAEDATVSITADGVAAGAKNWNVSCNISGSGKVTNGKVRITYDPDQLELQSDEVGEALNGATSDINDSLEGGNKEPGEVLLVFASASELDANGSMLNMVFNVSDNVKTGDALEIQVKVEELACNGEDINFTEQALNLTVGDTSGNGQSGSGQGSDAGSDSEKESESNTENQSDSGNGNSSGANGSSNGSNGGSQSSSESQSGAENQSSSGSQSSSSKTTSQVKTGDETNIWLPAGVAVVAVIILVAAGISISKKKKKEQE